MTDNEIIIAVAKLVGWKPKDDSNELFSRPSSFGIETVHFNSLPSFLTSRNAIIPVISRVCGANTDTRKQFTAALNCELFPMGGDFIDLDLGEVLWMIVHATPKQLCIALLKATGKTYE